MFLLILLSDLIGGILDALGGYHWLFARRYIMPFLFGVVASVSAVIYEHNLSSWWIGILVLPAMGTMTLGYPNGKNSGRGLWLFIQAVALSLGLTIFHHILWTWFVFIPYVVLAGVLGGIYKNWKQTVGDFVTGTYLGCILWFVR
jgi:hypothetical protein